MQRRKLETVTVDVKMSKKQSVRPSPEKIQAEPIKYGDVFPVSGDLAAKSISPQDASMMQTAENLILGKTQKGGAASIMQSAASKNVREGLVAREELTDKVEEEGVAVTETDFPGRHVVTETVAGQMVSQFSAPAPVVMTTPASVLEPGAITIGDALEAAAKSAGSKPVERSDAAAIQAAEVRATGRNEILSGGVAAAAQSAASFNSRIPEARGKITLSDVLIDAKSKLESDKAATRDDAEVIIEAELRNDPAMTTIPGGVGDSVVTAARFNQGQEI